MLRPNEIVRFGGLNFLNQGYKYLCTNIKRMLNGLVSRCAKLMLWAMKLLDLAVWMCFFISYHEKINASMFNNYL